MAPNHASLPHPLLFTTVSPSPCSRPAFSPTIGPAPASQGRDAGHDDRPGEKRMSDPAAASETTRIQRFLVALVSRVCDHPRLVLAGSLALCVLSAVAAATRLEYHTSRNDLISAQKDYQQRWKKYLDEFGDDDDIVIVVQGRENERMKAALDAV